MRVGVVGAGIRGRMFEQALVGFADVVGFAETNAALRDDAAATGVAVFGDHRELLQQARPDAVIVATPDFAHRDIAIDCAQAGVHLMVEKPLATTLDDARAIRDAVVESGVTCLVAFENRWNPHVVAARAELDRYGSVRDQRGMLSNSYYVPTQMLSWAAQSSPAWFLMPHTIDLASYLAGTTVTAVTAKGTRGVLAVRGIDTWDSVHALVELEGAGVANLSSSWILPDAGTGIVEFSHKTIADNGSVELDLTRQGLYSVGDGYKALWPVGGTVGGQMIGAPVWMVRDFVAGLQAGTPVGPDVHHGLHVTEAIVAIETSLRENRTVTLAEMAG